MQKGERILVIGAGFSGMAAAAKLAQAGYAVDLVEKNEQAGGRCRMFEAQGFHFDMGPSWYWMPDVFERFFNEFGYNAQNLYELKRLNPSYRVFFEDETMDVPADYLEFAKFLESKEEGAAENLEKFMHTAQKKYEVGMQDLVYLPSLSIFEFVRWDILKNLFKIDLLGSFSTHIRKYFKNPKIQQLMEFPVLFLGAKPKDTPALYSLMNYADIALGTWYPMGGMVKISQAFQKIAEEQGVHFHFNTEVQSFDIQKGKIKSVQTNQGKFEKIHTVISGADYHHIDQNILPKKYQNYAAKYWGKRKMAPTCLLFYLGINRKVEGLLHHNLFFDADFAIHAKEIYDDPQWPENPLFYVCAPSKTDPSVAPKEGENLFCLIPLAPDIKDEGHLHEKYLQLIFDRIAEQTGDRIKKEDLIYQKSFGVNDFKTAYHAYKGNAYGLANTLFQTAFLKPSIRSRKVKNLFYTGQLTVPGPGMPPSIISGQLVADYVKNLKDYDN